MFYKYLTLDYKKVLPYNPGGGRLEKFGQGLSLHFWGLKFGKNLFFG